MYALRKILYNIKKQLSAFSKLSDDIKQGFTTLCPAALRRTAMNNKNIEEIDFLSLTTEEAEKLGLNAIFEEEDGTYDWIYCMNMMKDRSMFSFYFKVVGLCFLPIVLMMLWMAASSRLSMSTFLITMLSFGGVLLVVVFAIWLVNTMYGGKYMLIYEMAVCCWWSYLPYGLSIQCTGANTC